MSIAVTIAGGKPPSPLAIRLGLSQEKLELVRSQIAPGAPDDVIEFYFELCRIAGFDPFGKMIHCVGRNAKVDGQWIKRFTFQTAIDGFRSIAEDSGQYDGQDEAEFEYDGDSKIPTLARVRVYRKGISRPFVGVARWIEYAQTDRDGSLSPMWAKMPTGQLAKCAEALALRKAFPKKLRHLYTNDEMGQADNVINVTPTQDAVPTETRADQAKRMLRQTTTTQADGEPAIDAAFSSETAPAADAPPSEPDQYPPHVAEIIAAAKARKMDAPALTRLVHKATGQSKISDPTYFDAIMAALEEIPAA